MFRERTDGRRGPRVCSVHVAPHGRGVECADCKVLLAFGGELLGDRDHRRRAAGAGGFSERFAQPQRRVTRLYVKDERVRRVKTIPNFFVPSQFERELGRGYQTRALANFRRAELCRTTKGCYRSGGIVALR